MLREKLLRLVKLCSPKTGTYKYFSYLYRFLRVFSVFPFGKVLSRRVSPCCFDDMRGKPNGERRTTRRETSCGVENCFLWDRKQINSQSAKGGKKRGINRKGSKFNTFTIRLRIFVPGNLLTKLGKLAATAMLLSRPDLYFIPRLLLPSRYASPFSFPFL